ncbi:MAG: hypothetical protein QW818_02585 [Candidatus Aenigmatarchaeota archaeon]
MIQVILNFLSVLPELLRIIDKVISAWGEAKRLGILDEINSALDLAEKAKTPEERSRAALQLARALSRTK